MELIKSLSVYFFKEDSGNEPVRKWLLSLTDEDRKIIGRDIRILQLDWPLGEPLVKSLGKGLWEIRSKLKDRNARILFVMHKGMIVLLHGFIKKTQKTPTQDIDIARKRIIKLEDNK